MLEQRVEGSDGGAMGASGGRAFRQGEQRRPLESAVPGEEAESERLVGAECAGSPVGGPPG